PKSHPDNEQTAASHAANIHRNLHINRSTSDRSDSKGRRPGIPLIGKPPTRSRDGLTTGKRAEFRARHGRMAPDYAADSSMSANSATESEWRNRIRRGRTGRTGGRTTSRTISLERHACTADGTDTEPTGWHGKRCPRPSSPHPPTATRTGSRPRLPRPDRDATGPTTVSPSRLDSATRPRRRPLIAREHHHHPRVTVLVERTTTSVSVVTACNSGSSPSVTSRPTPPRAGPPPNTN